MILCIIYPFFVRNFSFAGNYYVCAHVFLVTENKFVRSLNNQWSNHRQPNYLTVHAKIYFGNYTLFFNYLKRLDVLQKWCLGLTLS